MPANATSLRTSIDAWADRVADNWADELLEAMRVEAPVAAPTGDPRQRPPGTLQRAMNRSPVSGFGRRRGFSVIAPGIEALTTAKGARPHVIRPRSSGVLVFYQGGARRFARSVNHPGNAGTDWFARALAKHGGDTLRRAARQTSF